MEFPPQKFREIIFQLLYSMDGSGSAEAELIPFLMRELTVSKKHVSAAYEKAKKIWQQRNTLDQLIAEKSREYSLDRIKTVEKNVLRLAFYELVVDKELSEKIIISEAHRIARKFSSLEGASFVNAVLGTQDDGSALSTSEGDKTQ
jgi:transcription antitermination protein NusB